MSYEAELLARMREADRRVDAAKISYERTSRRRGELVREAREAGASWQQIADACGTSRTRARQILNHAVSQAVCET